MLDKLIQKKLPDPKDQVRRTAMGREAAVLGIVLNFIFALSKIVLGTLAGAISMIADGLNNVMDLMSSVIALGGFHLAAVPADKNHPYGHARMEYLASFLVSLIIIWTGLSLLWESGKTIIHPDVMETSALAVGALVFAMEGKVFLYRYNVTLGEAMDSELLVATGYDARGDVFATAAVLLSLMVYHFFSLNIDGWMGLLVAGIILKSGWESLMETVDSLLGRNTDPELIRAIMKDIKRFPVALGVHDMMYHDYGADNQFLTLHVEVNSEDDVMKIHQDIDEIERYISAKYHMDATIHIDPIRIDDPRSNALYDYVKKKLREIDSRLDLHDFRIVGRKDGLNLIFDVLMPMDLEGKAKHIDAELKWKVEKDHPEYALIATYDMDYQDLLEAKDE
ncbi:cation diffusion facilitator family transporter [Aedoeadaptatus urinae]|uniref:cation diffusion facilitator family transporter n=1 Tax=Aedoeadaptatus urinae TaxID=1871017 RepID=UPI00097D0862|nr:cation diffusion facilitator family transporter [Peptoniphilus urinae]